MASVTYEFNDPSTGFRATCTIEEVNGALVFTLDVDESTGTVADLRGLFFDLNTDNQAFLDTLRVTGGDVTDSMFKRDSVVDLGQGANVNGEVVNQCGKFDAGVEIGSSGLKGGKDDIQWTQFTLSSTSGPLSLDLIRNVDTALRATSVGDADGSRNGSLKLVGDAALGALSGFYFHDLNGNDIDDSGDVAVAGKLVELIDASGNVVASTTTDAWGAYLFTDLQAGNYRVRFQDSVAEGRDFVMANVGSDDAIDSDVDPATGMTDWVEVVAGVETTDVDAGVKDRPAAPPPPASISGRAFLDANRDGIRDAGEAIVAGMAVELLDATGVVAQTTTGADGTYSFQGLPAGDYTLRFHRPDGSFFTVRDAGGDDSRDSDVDEDGSTGTVAVAAGEDRGDVDAGVFTSTVDAADDALTVMEDEAGSVNILANDADAEGDAFSITGITGTDGQPAALGQAFTVSTAAGREGTVTVAADGTLSFTPGASFADLDDGQSDSFQLSYAITDAYGATDSATVTVQVLGKSPVLPPSSYDVTGTITTATHSLTFIMDATFSTYDQYQGVLPVDVNGDGINNIIDAMLGEVVKRAQGLAGDQRIDLILAGADGVLTQQTVLARDLEGLNPHSFDDMAALQAIFGPESPQVSGPSRFFVPSGWEGEDADFALALDAAGAGLAMTYGAGGARFDQVVILTTSNGKSFDDVEIGLDDVAAATRLATDFGARIDVLAFMDDFFDSADVLNGIAAAGGAGGAVITSPWDYTPAEAFQLDTVVPDSPAVTERNVIGIEIGADQFLFGAVSDGDGRIEFQIDDVTSDYAAGVSVLIDTDGDGAWDARAAANATFDAATGLLTVLAGPDDFLA